MLDLLLGEYYITSANSLNQKTFIEEVWEHCEQVDPKPIWCEIPESLKNQRFSQYYGTAQTSTVISSMVSTSLGTTTIIR